MCESDEPRVDRKHALFGVGGHRYAAVALPAVDRMRPAILSRAEREICRLILAGRSNVEISVERRVSVNTVENQVSAIFRKLDVPSRSVLASLYFAGECGFTHADDVSSWRQTRERVRARAQHALNGERRTGEAFSLWRSLVLGHWSVVDRFVTLGRDIVVGRKNEPRVRSMRALNEREQQVAGYLALGHSNSHAGQALHIGTSTVAGYVASLGEKLGTSNRVELVQLLALLVERRRRVE